MKRWISYWLNCLGSYPIKKQDPTRESGFCFFIYFDPGIRLWKCLGVQTGWWSERFPWNPKRFPFFYGWIVVVVGSIGIIMSIPGQTMGVSVFTEPLLEALGVNRLQLSLAYMIGTMASGFLMRRGGKALDKWGARKTACFASIGLGFCILFLSILDQLATWSQLGQVGAMVLAVIGFFGIRFTGQGMLTMVSRAMISKWFERRRGLIMSCSGVVVSFCFAVAPRGLGGLIDEFGWRMAWWALAALALFFMAPLAWLSFRDNPEECGLRMDGEAPDVESQAISEENQKTSTTATVEADSSEKKEDSTLATAVSLNKAEPAKAVTRKEIRFPVRREYEASEAIRTLAFWVFNFMVALYGLIATAYTFHIEAVGLELGLDRSQALGIFFPIAVVTVGFNFLAGWLSDQFRLKWLGLQMGIFMLLGMVGMMLMPSPWAWWIWVIGFGATQGYYGTLVGVTWPRLFGRKHLGEISGINMSTMVFSSALGPILFSVSQRYTESFKSGILTCCVVTLILTILCFWARNPQETEPVQ